MGAITQKDNSIEDPKLDDLEKVGTVARVVKILNMPDGTTTVIIQGRKRFALNSIITYEPYHIGSVKPLANAQKPGNQKNFEAVLESLKDISLQIIKKSSHIPPEAAFTIENIDSPNYLVNYICYNLDLDVDSKQQLLELDNIEERAEKALVYLSKEMQLLELKNQIQNKVKTDIDKQQRDYFLNQQLKTIKEELGDATNEQEIEELKQRARSKNWTEAVAEVFNKELSKLQRMNPVAMEYSIQLNYLDTLVSLPWGEYSKDRFDLKYAQKVLDRDHYGLEKVKERIVEYLAVLKLKNNMKSPIICLVGPPGVGKTSLGKSIAEALGRKYIRMSLGGLHDEAEIRGHRKTYIGAMPGRIIQNIKKAGTSNPVFVLDEIDKVSGATVNGDPSSALLEVLDPEQNMSFHDNFLEVDYDLSHVMFLATANTINSIHPALRDRMEVVDVSGYLLEEKYNIARKHLVPKQLKEHGILAGKVTFRKPVLEKIIENYTRESGVRNLEKTIAQLIRNQAVNIVMDKNYKKDITDEDLIKILGPARFQRNRAVENHLAGVATGLAWTAVGGEILFVEVS